MTQDRNDQLAALYRASYDLMLRVAYRLTGSMETAGDLVQDAFLCALFHAGEVLTHPKPEAWLMLTLKNLCQNENRRASSKDVSLDILLTRPPSEDEHGIEELLPTRLSPKDRELLLWRFQEQMDYSAIGDRLGISTAGSRSSVFRAVSRCRKLLSAENFSPSPETKRAPHNI